MFFLHAHEQNYILLFFKNFYEKNWINFGESHVFQGRNRHIFLRGQSHFSRFVSPVENSRFGTPKTNFRRFQKWKAKKKKKKKVLNNFLQLFLLSYFHLQFSTFHFTIFLLFFSICTPFPFFPFFLCLFFPATSAKISRSEVSEGTLPPCLPACYDADVFIIGWASNFCKSPM